MEAHDCIEQLQLEPTPAALKRIHHWLHRLQQTLQLSTDLVFRMDLVLNELIPNILEHGANMLDKTDNKVPSPSDPLCITLLQNAQGYALEVSDAGPAFNPLQQTYIPATDLQSASVSGRGIHLVKTFTDQQVYQHHAGRNVLTVTFYSAPSEATGE